MHWWIVGVGTALAAVALTLLTLSSGYDEVGIASWYGPGFHGNHTANGEVYDMYAYSAAHKTLPFGTIVRVTDLETGRSIVVRINDRGPYVEGRVIDLSFGAARRLGLSGETPDDTGRGITKVGLRVLVRGDNARVRR